MNKSFIPIIGGIIIIVAVVGFFVFSNSKKSQEQASDASKVTVRTPQGLMQAIDKDSIFESKDGGATFAPQFKIITNNQIGVADILSVAFHPSTEGDIVVGSVNDGLFRREPDSEGWTPIIFPPKNIYSFILDRNDPDKRMFASGVVNENGRIFKSVDGGDNWRPVYTEPGSKTVVTALAQHHDNTNIIFAGTSDGTIVKSTDGGESWKNIGNKIQGTIKDISFDAGRQNTVYLLSYNAKVYYSPNSGTEWIDWEEVKAKESGGTSRRSRSTENTGALTSAPLFLVADPGTSGTLYVGTQAGLFRSTDYGKNWKEINIIESAKAHPIRSIAINPNDSQEISFIAGKSFYKSTNYGDTWSVTPLGSQRDALFIAYDPFDTSHILIGMNGSTDTGSRRRR
jgi:photosystem II stability/assembly factor-like uncharacterized protein